VEITKKSVFALIQLKMTTLNVIMYNVIGPFGQTLGITAFPGGG